MSESIQFKESVRGIVEYVLKGGSLDDRFVSRRRVLEGTIAHGKLQRDNEKVYQDYEKEVILKHEFLVNNISLIIEGRADGIIKENGKIIIEEIKSTYKDLSYINFDYNLLHWAQGKFYGYIYCVDNNIDEIDIRLSYFNINNDEVRSFDKTYNICELEQFVYSLVNKYLEIIVIKEEFNKIKNESIRLLSFPFSSYRKGQRELAVNCFNTIKQNGILFAQAPTGIGKTISTIFPALKSIGENRGEKIVYLTAKTITRTVAQEAYLKLYDKGLKFKVVTITAKEKMCLNNEVKCNLDDCIYAKDYFTKINNVIASLIKKDDKFFEDDIIEYAKMYNICPFQLSLDLSEWCDGIICDYNYAFDPTVKLKRIFEERNEKIYEMLELVGLSREHASRYPHQFSGGQRQRLTIARALYKQADILVLDDCSSALDYATDAALQKQLQELKEMTKIIISQRTASLKRCDRIMVLYHGELVGFDCHEELLKNCTVYKEIYESQNSKDGDLNG